jgi:hypothetical protein
MKLNYLVISLLSCFFGFSQFNPSAPWMEEINSKKKGEELTIHEISAAFNSYWETRDRTVRGSGHNPYKRWEYHWTNKVNEQGYLISPEELWAAWNQKNASKQSRNTTFATPSSNWQPVGPFSHTNTGSWSSGQGRVNIVAVDPSNSNTIYLGAPAGGIWKSTDAGINWNPLSDYLPQIGVSGIAIDHTNSNVIYIATGDKDALDSYSIGVLKSIDGGITWNTTGLTLTGTNRRAGDIIMHPTNNQILWCATSVGLYKTINAGANWTVVQLGNFSQGNIRLKPNDPNTVYAVTTNTFFISTNGGDSFTIVSTGLPASSGRLVMDVTPANPDYIYILSANTSSGFQGIYRSTNSGISFTARNTTTNIFESNQAWFDLALAVSDVDAEEVYTGCLNVWKSTNGGTNFTKLNSWSAPASASYTHADIHYLGFQAGKLYCGSDGGIYVSQNGGANFADLTETAQISQYYKISVSKQSSGNMIGGLQDNGGYAYSGGAWKNYYGADGMDTAIDPNNQNLYYGFIQYGGTLYISNNAGNSRTGSVAAPATENGNWVTPLVSNSVGEIFSAYKSLYILNGNAWQLQSSAPVGTGNIDYIEVDPTDDNIMYVSNGSGLYKSTDRGINFSLIYTAHAAISSIEVNHTNNQIVYLTTSGTGGRVLKSINGGIAFTNITTGIPNIGKNIIVHQPQHSDNPLYVGTSLGVYYLDDTMTTWEPFDANLPNVSVEDLEINVEDAKLIAATYGRGVWQTDIPVQLASDDIKMIQIQAVGTLIDCGNVIPQIEVQNNGVNTINSVDISYTIDGTTNLFTWNGTITSTNTAIIDLPQLTLNRGIYELNVISTIPNDAFASNNSLSKTIFVNDNGTIGVVNPFTNTTDALISYNEGSPSTSQWVRGIRSGGSMDTAGNTVYTTNLSGNYPDNRKSYLVSQCYDLSNVINPQISFSMKFDLELNWDILYVEYSTNFGASWSVLGTAGTGWYNSNRAPGGDCLNCPGAQWTGANTTNNTYTYPLNALNSETNVIFRFVFHSDESVNRPGVNIDNFLINGTLSSQNFELQNVVVYPNPSKGIFNISLGNLQPETIEVYDVMGKLIMKKNAISVTNFQTSIDLSAVAQGIYFIKISANGQNSVKRIVKE